MKALVTGGTGFVGRHLLRLLDRPDERRRLSDGALLAAAGLRRWTDTARDFAEAVTEEPL